MNPPAEQKPAFAFDHPAHSPTLSEKLRSPHLIDRLAGVLHNMKFVVNDPALWRPTQNAGCERFPHVHTCHREAPSLQRAQLCLEELVQGLTLSFTPKPQRLACLQVAHYRQKLLGLSQVDLIYTQLPQNRLPPAFRPSLQISLVNS